jgi:archaellum component FlaC
VQLAVVAWFGFLRVLVFPYMSTPSIPDDEEHNISAISYTWNACTTDTIVTLIGMWVSKLIGDTYQAHINTNLVDLKTDVNALKNHFEAPDGLIPTMQKDIDTLKEDVKVLKEDVKVLKEDVKVLKEDVKVLKEDVKVLKEDVKVLKEDIADMKGDIKMILNKLNGLFPTHFNPARIVDINSIDYPSKVIEGTVLIDITSTTRSDPMTTSTTVDLPDITEGLVNRKRNQNTHEYRELQTASVRFGAPSYKESALLYDIRDDVTKRISRLKQD